MPADVEGRFFWLLDRIVRREGIGDVLADGIYWAARRIGKGAEKFDHNTIKKHEQLPLKLGMLNPVYFLMYSTGEKINITQIEGQFPQAPFPTREEREDFVKDWIQVPRRKVQAVPAGLGTARRAIQPATIPSIEASCDIVDWQEKMHYIDDALGHLRRPVVVPAEAPLSHPQLPEVHLGRRPAIDFDEAELWKAATRNRTLLRAINVRRGMRRADEKPPEDHWKKRFPELEKKLLDAYYKFKGWNSDGIPTAESLRELDLDYVAEDLEQTGDHPAMAKIKKKIKSITIDVDKCNGCRACEVICSLFHAYAALQQQQPGALAHPDGARAAARHLSSGLRRRVHRGRMHRPRQLHHRRQGVRRVRLLPGLLSVARPVQGTRFRPAAQVRHVRGRRRRWRSPCAWSGA